MEKRERNGNIKKGRATRSIIAPVVALALMTASCSAGEGKSAEKPVAPGTTVAAEGPQHRQKAAEMLRKATAERVREATHLIGFFALLPEAELTQAKVEVQITRDANNEITSASVVDYSSDDVTKQSSIYLQWLTDKDGNKLATDRLRFATFHDGKTAESVLTNGDGVLTVNAPQYEQTGLHFTEQTVTRADGIMQNVVHTFAREYQTAH